MSTRRAGGLHENSINPEMGKLIPYGIYDILFVAADGLMSDATILLNLRCRWR